jgi:Ca2+-binding RTX toxin-like protein
MRFALIAVLVVGTLPASLVLAASNAVTAPSLGRSQSSIGANNLKPSSCAALTLTTLVVGVTGTANNDLVLGSASADVISSAGGNDCVVGGGGNDSINCGAGTDVAIGGPGIDTFNLNCETQIQ